MYRIFKIKNESPMKNVKGLKVNELKSVEPVFNGHPRDLRYWPLNTGGRVTEDH